MALLNYESKPDRLRGHDVVYQDGYTDPYLAAARDEYYLVHITDRHGDRWLIQKRLFVSPTPFHIAAWGTYDAMVAARRLLTS